MDSCALREFRRELSDITGRVQHRGERVVVSRNGKPAFAVVPVDDLEALQRLEDEIDLADARKARKERGRNIPLKKEQVMVSLDGIRKKRDAILHIAARHGARDVRVFGSFVRGDATEQSDLDLLVRMEQDRSLLDRIGMIHDLEDLLGRKVDVVNENALHHTLRDRILREVAPL